MMTAPDRILRTALELLATGQRLDATLRFGTQAELARQPQMLFANPVLAGHYRTITTHPDPRVREQHLDAAFRHIFTSPGSGASTTAQVVSAFLKFNLQPAFAVLSALRLEDRGRICRKVAEDWCRNGQRLYRPDQVAPHLRPHLHYASVPAVTALSSLAAWVHERVRYVSDAEKWGQADRWQSPAQTLRDGSGDCEDMGLVVWSAAALLGLSPGRLVVGTIDGVGHAWVEFPEEGLFAEATNGTAGYLQGTGPSRYAPWVYIEPTRCFLVQGSIC